MNDKIPSKKQNIPRISKWIGGIYLFLTIFIIVLFTVIAIESGLLLLPLIIIVFVLALIGTTAYSFYKTVYVIKDGFLCSWSPFAFIKVRINDIIKVERTMIPVHFRVGASLYSGRFYIPGVGWTKAIITNLTDGVLITDKNRKHYLITPSNPDNFIKSLKAMINS